MTTAQMDELDDRQPEKSLHRSIYRNVAVIVGIAEILTLLVILATWLLVILGAPSLATRSPMAWSTARFMVSGVLIGMAAQFAPRQGANNGGTWYPNVLALIAVAALNGALALALAVWCVAYNHVAPRVRLGRQRGGPALRIHRRRPGAGRPIRSRAGVTRNAVAVPPLRRQSGAGHRRAR